MNANKKAETKSFTCFEEVILPYIRTIEKRMKVNKILSEMSNLIVDYYFSAEAKVDVQLRDRVNL